MHTYRRISTYLRKPVGICTYSNGRGYHFQRELLDELVSRDLTSQVTRPDQLSGELKKGRQVVYAGIDPTAKALHVGHLLPLMCLLHFQLRGHAVTLVVGGATGLVGDPSGKSAERIPMAKQKAEWNATRLNIGIGQFFTSARRYAGQRMIPSENASHDIKILDNLTWLGKLNLLDFLGTAGVHPRVNTMIARDSVRTRMASQQGISFTEFTYQLLQAYDFYHLYHKIACTIQIGGADQWGNILAGLDLIQRMQECGNEGSPTQPPNAYGITTPLLTTTSGAKFGKSEGNAIWLDANLTSVYEFNQFFLRTADADIEKYLRMLTLIPLEKIHATMREHEVCPEKRIAQRLLADEVTEMIHGEDGVQKANQAAHALFESDLSKIRVDNIVLALSNDPRLVHCDQLDIIGQPVVALAATYNLVKSRSEARRMANANGLYLNNTPVKTEQKLELQDFVDRRIVIIRAGKDKHLVLVVKG